MPYTTDIPHIPNKNGIVQNLPVEIVSQRSKDGSRKPLCNCCPYGYHIDLDFVRYCEALSQGRELAASKQQRRERRRQRQSMEVLLGLTSPLVWNLEQQLPQVPVETSSHQVSPDSAYTDAIVRDALHKAVLDFEETLHRSHPKPITNTAFQSECPREKTILEVSLEDVPELGSSMQHAESVCSVSSMSAASSTVTPGQTNGHCVANHSTPHDDTGLLQDFDVASVGSAASGLSTGALQNIREQMAMSLERMKELEEQVKLIPVLQVQLSVLKEEKRKMLLQLRLEEAERNKINSELSASAVISGDGEKVAEEPLMRVRSQSCSEGSERNYIQRSNSKQMKSNLRDVGVTCSVVTREVGVSPQQPRIRNVKTNTHSPLNHLSISASKIEEIPPDLSYNRENLLASPYKTKLIKVSPVNINIDPILNKVITKSAAMNTDLLMINTYSDVEVDKNINKAIQTYSKTFSSKLHSQNSRDFGIQVDSFPEIAPVLLIVEKHDVGVQCEKSHYSSEAFSQTEDLSEHLVDVGVLAKPRVSHSLIQVKAKTRDIGISENAVNDVLCEKCKVKKQSIGVGNHNIKNLSEDEASISLSNIGIMQNKITDISAPPKKTSRTIACGTTTCTAVSKGTSTENHNLGTRDFGVNTVKRKLVDAAVGDTTVSKSPETSVSVCDKCDAVIQNVAKNMLTKNSELHNPSPAVGITVTSSSSSNLKTSTSATPSRIPRPASSNTISRSATTTTYQESGTSEKLRIQRQDTYTKLQINTESLESIQHTAQEKTRCETSICPAERLLAMQAGRSQESEEEHAVEHGQDFSGSETEEMTKGSPQENTHSLMEPGLFQPIQHDTRKKTEPSKEMKAALKVLNDYLRKSSFTTVPHHLKNATNIIQQEWFKISSTASANPLDVEDYLDCFEEMSSTLLEYIVNMTDMSGNTAMHYAVSHGNFDVVSILLDSKVCNINRPNAAGYTCVMLVSLAEVRSETDKQVIRRLFQLADVNVRAKQHGQTALMLAVSHGRLDMVRLLVEAGADMNIQDEDGSTALMCAAEHGHTAIVKHLLSQPDCDVSIVDCDGSTALNIAMDAGNKDIGVLLYAHEHFSRGSSPYTSLRHKRSKSATPTMLSVTPPSPSPIRERLPRHEQTM